LSFGLAFAGDNVDPEGGAPIPFAAMLPEDDRSNKLGDDSKTVSDFVVGVTQIFGRRTRAQFNYSLSHASGYLTDPYKLISVLDPVTGDPVASANPGLNLLLFENRPDTRTKHSIYAEMRRHLDRDIVNVSYRFMTDDWGVDSHTVDFRYRWKFKNFYLQPHLRYYMQGAADFYVFNLYDGDPLPKEATADYRLGEFDAYTVGVKYGRPLGKGREWGLRLEYYTQSGNDPPGSALGSLAGLEVNPDVNALVFQAGYRF
jgi:glycosyltransferase involved in cell wall biosynthesis